VVAPAESLPPLLRSGDLRRGRMAEAERQVEGLFESLLSEVFA
jgi:hypothetical protein